MGKTGSRTAVGVSVGLAWALVSTAITTSARGQVTLVASNFNANSPQFRQDNGYFMAGTGFGGDSSLRYAIGFTPMETATFLYTALPLRVVNPAINNATITLYGDNAGLPGTVLEVMQSGALPPENAGSTDNFNTIASTLQPTLQAGSTYWLSVTLGHNTSATWLANNIGQMNSPEDRSHLFARGNNSSANWQPPAANATYTLPAYAVYGAVPEPASLGLIAIAAVSLLRGRRSRR